MVLGQKTGWLALGLTVIVQMPTRVLYEPKTSFIYPKNNEISRE